MSKNITKEIYDEHAAFWERREPNSLSDFTGRPPVFDICGDVSGLDILDIGCGEGYCARILKSEGARKITGIDISPEMIELAKNQDQKSGQGNTFQIGDGQDLSLGDGMFDLVLGVFVYNYMTIDEMKRSHKEVFRVLKPGGRLVFSVPHPAFPQIKSSLTSPFFFDFNGAGYFSARNVRNHGKIFCRDGKELPVQMVHKLIADYFDSLSEAGFSSMPQIRELGVTAENLDLDPGFFGPVNDIPLHMAFSISKH